MYLDQPKSPIAIKPSNEGKFTRWALSHGFKGVQDAAKHVMANQSHYDKDVVAMANFACNAKKWSK
jgi:hypothetical protein